MFLKLMIAFLYLTLATSFYSLSITNIDGKPVGSEKLKGRLIAIGVVDAKAPDPAFVRFLDSLQSARQELQVMILPASDLTKGTYSEASKLPYKDLKSSLIVLKPSGIFTEKDKNDLTRWLTSVDQNGHFQVDVTTASMLFVLSKEGELKSVLGSGFPEKVLTNALQ
jgi:hypothetical protein